MAWDLLLLALQLLWRRIGLLVVANMLWLGLSVLIVPWPAATAGLFYLVKRIVAEELEGDVQPAGIGDFWAGMRRYWLRGSVTAIGDLGCFVLLVGAVRFYGQSAVEPLRWLLGPILLIGVVWAGAQLYLFPLLLWRTNRPIAAVAREAVLMAIGYPLNTFSLLLTVLIMAAGATVLAGPILLVFFSFSAMLQTILLRHVLVQRGEVPPPVRAERQARRERRQRR